MGEQVANSVFALDKRYNPASEHPYLKHGAHLLPPSQGHPSPSIVGRVVYGGGTELLELLLELLVVVVVVVTLACCVCACLCVCVLFSFSPSFLCATAPFVYSIEGSRAVSEEYRVELRTTMGALLPPPRLNLI